MNHSATWLTHCPSGYAFRSETSRSGSTRFESHSHQSLLVVHTCSLFPALIFGSRTVRGLCHLCTANNPSVQPGIPNTVWTNSTLNHSSGYLTVSKWATINVPFTSSFKNYQPKWSTFSSVSSFAKKIDILIRHLVLGSKVSLFL